MCLFLAQPVEFLDSHRTNRKQDTRHRTQARRSQLTQIRCIEARRKGGQLVELVPPLAPPVEFIDSHRTHRTHMTQDSQDTGLTRHRTHTESTQIQCIQAQRKGGQPVLVPPLSTANNACGSFYVLLSRNAFDHMTRCLLDGIIGVLI